MTPIEIAGVGVVGAGAYTVEDFQRQLYSPADDIGRIRIDDGVDLPVLRVDDAAWTHGISKRVLRRLDRFTELAIYAAEQAVASCPAAGQALDGDPSRIGLSIGNNYGGWTYVASMMKPLYERGMTAINPFVATAWFPAAAQGEISIRLGIKGASKTFAVERLSAAYAIEFAALLLEQDLLDVVVAGGAEAPLTEAVLASMHASHIVSDELPAGEAACMLTLKRKTSSNHPQIVGMGKGSDPQTALAGAVADAGLIGRDVDLLLVDPPRGAGEARHLHLTGQLEAVTALCGRRVPVAQPLPFGETVGAAFSLQLAAACLALERQQLPVSRFEGRWAAELDRLCVPTFHSTARPLVNVAALSSDDYGQWVAAVVMREKGAGAPRGTISHAK
jgi:3-oxoacyl-[acyl-carrier-protein] synthase II